MRSKHHAWRSVPPGASLGREPESRQRILAAGIPFVPGATAAEEAVALLDVAAGIEHGLMVEYLSAACSTENPLLSEILMRVAGEELAHLIAVQNLLLLLGAEPYLGRQDYCPPPLDPFPFRRESLTLETLSKYVCCEAPPLNQIRNGQRVMFGKAQRRWAESAPFVNRVGALYAKMYWLFMDDDAREEGWPDFPADLFARQEAGHHVPKALPTNLPRQVGAKDWENVREVANASDARRTVLAIAGQGEGGPAGSKSHFEQLLEAYAIVERGGVLAVNAGATARPAARPGDDLSSLLLLVTPLYNLVVSALLLGLTLAEGGSEAGGLRRGVLASSAADWEALVRTAQRVGSDHPAAREAALPSLELTALTEGDSRAAAESYVRQVERVEVELGRLLDSSPSYRRDPFLLELRAGILNRRALCSRLEPSV